MGVCMIHQHGDPLEVHASLHCMVAVGGPAPVLFRSGAHVRRPFVRRPRGISS
jgi:hypothetical protein